MKTHHSLRLFCVLGVVMTLLSSPCIAQNNGLNLQDTIKFISDELDANGTFDEYDYVPSTVSYSLKSFRGTTLWIVEHAVRHIPNVGDSSFDNNCRVDLSTVDIGSAKVVRDGSVWAAQIPGKFGITAPSEKSAKRLVNALNHAIGLAKNAPKGPFDP